MTDTAKTNNGPAEQKGHADSPKRQGDALATGAAAKAPASEKGVAGDSPKRQGDPLRHAVDEAARK